MATIPSRNRFTEAMEVAKGFAIRYNAEGKPATTVALVFDDDTEAWSAIDRKGRIRFEAGSDSLMGHWLHRNNYRLVDEAR